MRICIFAWLLPCVMMTALPAQADTLSDVHLMKSQMHKMQAKIDKMEAELQVTKQQSTVQEKSKNQSKLSPVVQFDLPSIPQPISTTRSDANVFNPQVSFILNGGYNAFTQSPTRFSVPGFALGDAAGLGNRGMSINESELNFQSNVDNRFFASSTLSLAPQGGLRVEEAFVQTLDLPAGLTIKGGRFFSAIGYINQFHPHHDSFIDRSLANRAFLNSIYAGDGLQVRWLAPMDSFLELGGEVLSGDRYPGGGAPLSGVGAWDVFAHMGDDVGFSNSWLAGISWLQTKAVARKSFDNTGTTTGTFDGTNRLLIGSLVWKWAPQGNPVDRNFKFQTELFHGQSRGVFTNSARVAGLYDGNHWGGYAEGVYQFTHGWDVGLRYSMVSASNTGNAVTVGSVLDTKGIHPNRSSFVLGYSNSEFSRFRLQYSLDKSHAVADHQLALQYIMLIGAHGAHQF